MKILYAEDEKNMSDAIVDILTYHNYNVDAVYDGQDALDYAKLEKYDGIILDIMMPKLNGLEVLKQLRESGCKTPVMLLTAKSQIEDKIDGLELGADDYLAKPFDTREFIARLRAMLRRKEVYTPNILSYGNVCLNSSHYELSVGDKSTILPKPECRLMEFLLINSSTFVPTEDLLTNIWGYNTDAEIGIVWVYISYLRKKLAKLGADIEIKAKRNIGYKLEKKHD